MTTADDLGIRGIDEIEALDVEGSAIYRGLQRLHNRFVVIKILDPLQDPLVPRRFDIRRKALNRFAEGPGVVPLYESGVTTDGRQYLVMPYFRIGSLADQIVHGPTPWHRAAELIKQSAEIVGRGNGLGLVLGDLKPSSILLADASSPLIAVYGMAARRFDNGAPTYAAPETAPGATLTPAADVYSLSLVLAALIAGRPPNRGRPSREFMTAVEALAPPRIVEVIDHGLTESPVNRFGSCRHLAAALDSALAGEPQEIFGSAEDNTGPVDWEVLLSQLPHPASLAGDASSNGNGNGAGGADTNGGAGSGGDHDLEELLEQPAADHSAADHSAADHSAADHSAAEAEPDREPVVDLSEAPVHRPDETISLSDLDPGWPGPPEGPAPARRNARRKRRSSGGPGSATIVEAPVAVGYAGAASSDGAVAGDTRAVAEQRAEVAADTLLAPVVEVAVPAVEPETAPAENLPTVDPVTVDPVSLTPVTVDPVSVDPVSLTPVTVDPVTVDPVSVDPVAVDPVAVDLVAVPPGTSDPTTVDPATGATEADGAMDTRNGVEARADRRPAVRYEAATAPDELNGANGTNGGPTNHAAAPADQPATFEDELAQAAATLGGPEGSGVAHDRYARITPPQPPAPRPHYNHLAAAETAAATWADHGAEPAPDLHVDDQIPFRTFDRTFPAPPESRAQQVLEAVHDAWYNHRRTVGGLLAFACFAVIAGIVVLLLIRDLRPASTPLRNAPSAPVVTTADTGSETTAPPTTQPDTSAPPTSSRKGGKTTATAAAPTSATAPATAATTPASPTTGATPTTPAPTGATITASTVPPAKLTQGLPTPQLATADVTRIRATSARIEVTSPACVSATFVYGVRGGATSQIVSSTCSTAHTLLMGTVTPALTPATAYTVTVVVMDGEGHSSRQTLSFTTLG